jgi:alpha-glucoside transport system permease protein
MTASTIPKRKKRVSTAPLIMKQGTLAPWLYLTPAIIVMLIFVVYPTLNTLGLSFLDTEGVNLATATCQANEPCWGPFENYRHALTDEVMLKSFRNNLLWIVLMVSATVGLGLVIAVLVDKIKYESWAKALIFMPMAISFVGAGIIWGFVYDFKPEGEQIGLLNGIIVGLGQDPIPWLTRNPIMANVALIIVGIWIWTGFCMTILSAALKGVPEEIIEASRVDGATEWQIFWRILVPMILPTIVVVITTMVVNVLKIFDIVYVMGQGQPELQVIATRMYQEQFVKFNSGYSAAIAVIVILAILPIAYINIQRFREQEAMR